MRKVIWCGMAVVVMGAAAALLTADYAARNPNTAVARYVQAACELGVRCNPLIYWNCPGVNHVAAAPGRPVAGGLPLPAPLVMGAEQEEPPLADQMEKREVVEPIIVDAAEEAEPAVRVAPAQTDEPAQLGDADPRVAPEAGDDSFKLPTVMPYADETDDEAPADAVMADCAYMNQFFSWLMTQGNDCPAGQASCPACKKNLGESLMEYLASMFASEMAADVAVPAEPVEAETGPASDAESQEDGTARLPQSTGLREDPNYHHQYPGCPYTGACPYPHNYIAPKVKPVEAPRTPRPAKPEQQSFHLDTNGDGPVHTDVDTMECRPTDVPKGVAGPF